MKSNTLVKKGINALHIYHIMGRSLLLHIYIVRCIYGIVHAEMWKCVRMIKYPGARGPCVGFEYAKGRYSKATGGG